MKKLIKLLSLIMALTLFCTLFACENTNGTEGHVHDYSTTKYDENRHWLECSCGGKTDQISHSVVDGKCSCGYDNSGGSGTGGGGNSEIGGPSAPPHKHEYVDGKCVVCQRDEPVISSGLTFTLTKDGNGYVVFAGGCQDSHIVIPSTYEGLPVVELHQNGFINNSKLIKVDIPATVTEIGDTPFYNCRNLEHIEVDYDNPVFKSIDGNLYSKDGKNLIKYAVGKKDNTFTIPEHVTTIMSLAFFRGDSLRAVTVPENVTLIESGAFEMCTSLQSVKLHDNVTLVGHVFASCRVLTGIEIPKCMKEIPGGMFYQCFLLSTVIIPEGIDCIGEGAFEDCQSLKSIKLPASLKEIQNIAFSGCVALNTIKFSGSTAEWNAIEKGVTNSYEWNRYVPATEVICTDGTER